MFHSWVRNSIRSDRLATTPNPAAAEHSIAVAEHGRLHFARCWLADPNKFLTKLASDMDKTDGFTLIETHTVESVLAQKQRPVQQNLFAAEQDEKDTRLDQVADKIRSRFGTASLRRASTVERDADHQPRPRPD